MMRKNLVVLLAILSIIGCSRSSSQKPVLAKINNYEITNEEFEEEFKESPYARLDTYESRKEFLENIINRKLILQDAQKRALDRNGNLLKSIERFWEQSLLKLTLDIKSKELLGLVSVSDKEIEEAYQKLLEEGKTDQPYEKMYGNIKWQFTRVKEEQLMEEWLSRLHKDSEIRVNYSLLSPKRQ